MTLLDEPMVVLDVDDPVVLEEVPPRTLLARAVPVLVVFALLGLIGGAGTFAAFSASTDNPATFATGTLILENTVTGGTGTCSSTESDLGTNLASCDSLFQVTAKQPGQEDGNTVVLENTGSMDAAKLTVHAEGLCTNAPTGTYSGTGTGVDGDLCDQLQLKIQEYTDGTFTTPSGRCVYPADANAACVYDPAATLAAFTDPSGHGTYANAISILDDLGDEGLPPSTPRYFRVDVKLPSTAGNDVQGRIAEFNLTWRLES